MCRIKFVLVLLIISFQSWAQDSCSNKLIDRTYLPKNNDQGNLSWCFAFTTADLLSFYEKTPLSSYSIGNNFHRILKTKNMTSKGGDVASAVLSTSISDRICREAETDFTGGDWYKLSNLINELGRESTDALGMLCEHMNHGNENIKNFARNIFSIISKLSVEERLDAIFKLSCNEKYELKNKYNVFTSELKNKSPEQIVNDLDQVLEKNEPASIGYDIDIVLRAEGATPAPYKHASTVVGRRWNAEIGQCEYLIKNSWGDSCPKKIKIDCQNGEFWVARDKLKQSIQVLYSVEVR